MKDSTKLSLKELLYFLHVGAGVAFALSSPIGVSGLYRGLSTYYKREGFERKLYERLHYLRRKELVRRVQVGDEVKIILTDEGNRRVLRANVRSLSISLQKPWDRKWRLVFFDIPERKRVGRDALRNKLRELGFLMINHSVWVHPYPCEKEVDFVAAFFGMQQYVHLATTESLTNDRVLRKKFNIA